MSRAGSKVSPIYLLCIEKNRKLPLDCIRTELRSFSFSSVIKFFTNCLVESFLYSERYATGINSPLISFMAFFTSQPLSHNAMIKRTPFVVHTV